VGAERVLCGITYHSIQHAGPRRLQYRAGIKPVQIAPCVGGATPALEEVAALLRRAGFATDVVSHVDHAIWQKLLHNAIVNPTSALTGLTCREMLDDPSLMAFMRSLCDEIVAVMRAKGIPVPDEEDPFRPVIGSLKALGKNRPSMWQDLSRRKRTEVDALNGAVVVEAERLGLRAPHNAAITLFIHSRERQTFMRKDEIAQKLGIEEHRSRTSGTNERAVPAPRRHETPSGALPLESTRKLKELVHAYYRDLAAASDDPHRLVAACSALGPVEIVRAFGIAPYFPEHHAVLISTTGHSARYLAATGAEGYSQFVSSGMRSDIGALLEGQSPLRALHGIAGPPRPDLAVYSTNTGRELLRWFEFYGTHYGVPAIGFHPSPALHNRDQNDGRASTDQIHRVVQQVEARVGSALDQHRLSEVVRLSAEAAGLWARVLDLAHAVPSPLTFFDAIVHLTPMVLLRGTQECVDYYRQLLSELEHRASEGIGAVPNETHRFYWDGPPVWSASRTLADIFAERGVAVVASTYAQGFALQDLDGDDPLHSMARAYSGVFANQSETYKTSYLEKHFRAYGVDAAVFHDCRTSAEASHVRYGLGTRVERLTAVPALLLEADAHDPRLFSAEELKRKLGDFIERHRELFADRLVAY
jgi:benzoyl-CoA reductase/2-hydroxyglutaryl-CoA dehydratase subunit BcrC/BadD/HgdB